MNDQQLAAEVVRLLAARKKIEAIKLVRERTGTGLAEAKKWVEQVAKGRFDAALNQAEAKTQHAIDHQFDQLEARVDQFESKAHEYVQRPGLGPGEVPAPKNNIVTAAVVLMIFLFGLFYLFGR